MPYPPDVATCPDLLHDAEFDELTAASIRPAVLVMGRDDDDAEPVSCVLRGAGYDVLTCGGPGRGACPVLMGERCPLREIVDAALVFVREGPAAGALPRLTCAAHGPSPAVVAIEGRTTPLTVRGRQATIGAKSSPDAIVGAITLIREIHADRAEDF